MINFHIDITHPLGRYLTFKEGVEALGGVVVNDPEQADWYIRWNNIGPYPKDRCLVAENAYLGDSANRPYYALAVGGHNGSGYTPDIEGRWDRMELKLKPWYEIGDWILICTQRGIGSPEMAMPEWWSRGLEETLQTDKHIEIRKPPSRDTTQRSLEEHFNRAWAVVVWTSNVGTLALMEGIPAFLCGPHHICKDAMITDLSLIENPPRMARLPAFNQLASAQFTHEEIQSGWVLELLCSL